MGANKYRVNIGSGNGLHGASRHQLSPDPLLANVFVIIWHYKGKWVNGFAVPRESQLISIHRPKKVLCQFWPPTVTAVNVIILAKPCHLALAWVLTSEVSFVFNGMSHIANFKIDNGLKYLIIHIRSFKNWFRCNALSAKWVFPNLTSDSFKTEFIQ